MIDNPGVFLKEISDVLKVRLGLGTASVKQQVVNYVTRRNENLSLSDVQHKSGYIITAFTKPHISIRRFLELYMILGYDEVKMHFILKRRKGDITVGVTIPLDINVSNYGVYLKPIVNELTLRYNISPTRLESYILLWVKRTYSEYSSADVNHKAGNITTSLGLDHITWKRLLDFFCIFDPTEIEVITTSSGPDGSEDISITIDVGKMIKNEI